MKQISRFFTLSILILLLASGCGGSGGDGGSSEPGDTDTTSFSIEGAAVKGPLAGAVVNLYEVDLSAADLKGSLLDEGSTGSDAAIDGLEIDEGLSGLVLLEFVADEDTVEVNTGEAPVFDRLITVCDVQRIYDGDAIYATPLTTMVVSLAQRKADTGSPYAGNGDDAISETEFVAALDVAQNQVKSTLGFGLDTSVDIFTVPPMITSETDTTEEQTAVVKYRQAIEALAAIADQVASDSAADDSAQDILDALVDDLSDGVIDGENEDGPIDALTGLDEDIATTLATVDLTTLLIPGTDRPVSDVESELVEEMAATGETTNTDALENDTIEVDPEQPGVNPDSDGDGVVDVDDAFPSDDGEWLDTDGDTIGNNADTDDDNDGVVDADDAFPLDATETVDSDNDGVGDNSDAFPLDPTEALDTDGDGVGDNSDPEPYPAVSFTTPAELFIEVGEQQDNAAQATPAQTFVYQSSDEAIATVDSSGRVTGVSVGSATISAYISGTPAADTTVSYTLNVYETCTSCTTYRRILDEADIDSPIDMFEQADGKIIVLSQTSTSRFKNKAILLTRLYPDGSLDSTFGTGGHVTYSYAGILSSYYMVSGLAVQSSGKILVLGDDSDNRKTVVTRFNTDGSLDTSFGTSGHYYQYQDGTLWGSSVIALDGSDNIILSLGFMGTTEIPVESQFIRLTADGALDSSWDGDGLLSVSDFYVLHTTVLDDGKLVAAGTVASDYAVIRFNQNGTVDTGFGTAGLVTRDVGSNDQPRNVMALSNGDILVVGSSVIASSHLAVLLRIDTDGDWATDFNGNGEVGLNFNGTDSYASAALEQADGKIVVVGVAGDKANNAQIALARVNADGSLDSAIPATNSIADGIVTYDLDYEESAGDALSVIRRANGGYLILGVANTEQYYDDSHYYYFSDTYLIGLDPNGALDNSSFIATGLANEVVTDFDGDGIRDRIDMDDDQDGFFDDEDSYPFDTDNDGLDNDVDPDDDGDGIADADDIYPFDLDNDGYLNFIDPDDDGDGVDDDVDAFPWDPSEQYDTDGDGIGNNADTTPYPVLTFDLSGDQTIGVSETLDNPATASFGTEAIQYTSSDTDVATVDASGTVTPASTGTVTIYADLTDWPDTPVSYQLTIDLSCSTCTSSTATVDVFTADLTNGVIELADGDLLVFGYEETSYITSVVARLNFDGTLDSSFNSGSPLQFTYAANTDTEVIDAAQQSDGKILLLSEYTPSTTDFLITRLNADGSIDTSYGTSGHVLFHDSVGDFVPGAMAMQSDDYLVVSGYYSESGVVDAVVVRLTTNGDMDSGFGYMGLGISMPLSDAKLFDVVLDGNDIVAVGTDDLGESAVLLRLTSTGDLDTGFNTTGYVSTSFAGEGVEANNVIVQSTGQYVISGYLEDGEIFISRYNTDGSLDTTFGASGISREGVSSAPFSSLNESYALLEQSDGTLLVAGGADLTYGYLDSLVLWRFDADGVIDEVVTSSLGFEYTVMAGYDLTNSISGDVIVAVGTYEVLSNTADMVLYGVNIDGTEDTDRFQ